MNVPRGLPNRMLTAVLLVLAGCDSASNSTTASTEPSVTPTDLASAEAAATRTVATTATVAITVAVATAPAAVLADGCDLRPVLSTSFGYPAVMTIGAF